MGIRGKGIDSTSALVNQIRSTEQRAKTIDNIRNRKAIEGDDKGDVRDRAGELKAQAEAVAPYTKVRDPQVRSAAERLASQILQDQLAVEDPTLALYTHQLGVGAAGASQEAPSAPMSALTDAQFSTVMTLVGDHLSMPELNAIRLLEPRLTESQQQELLARRSDDYKAQGATANVFSSKRLGVTGSGLLPGVGYMISLFATAGRTFHPAVGVAIPLLSGAAGSRVGDALKNRIIATAGDFGVNRLDGLSVENEMVRVVNRAKDSDTFKGTGPELRKELRNEAQFTREMLSLRERTGVSTPKEVTTAMTRYATLLEQLSMSPDARGDKEPRALLEEGVNALRKATDGRLEGLKAPALPAPSPTYAADAAMILEAHFRAALTIDNAPLQNFISSLREKGGKATEGDIRALQLLAGALPSMNELGAVAILEREGIVTLRQVWGDAAPTVAKDGVLAAADKLPGRVEGEKTQAKGERRLKITEIGGIALPVLLAATGLPVLFAFAGAGLGQSLGKFTGKQLAMQGVQAKMLTGVEVAPGGVAVRDEHALLLMRASDPAFLVGIPDAKLKTVLKDEAQNIEIVLESGRQFLGSPEGSSGLARSANLTGFFYDKLEAFQQDLVKLSGSTGTAAEIRKELAAAQANLLEPQVGYNAMVDLTNENFVDETPEPMINFALAQRAFLREAKLAIESQATSNTTLAREATLLVRSEAALEDSQRKALGLSEQGNLITHRFKSKGSDDSVVDLAKAIAADPFGNLDIEATKNLVTRRDAIVKGADAAVNNTTITEKRAGKVVQELVNLFWTQLYPMMGLGSGGQPPKLNDVLVGHGVAADGAALGMVVSKVGDDGNIVAGVRANGSVAFDTLDLNLGGGSLGKLAEQAVVRYAQMATGKLAEVAQTTLLARRKPKLGEETPDYSFQVQLKGGAVYSVSISPEGMVRPGIAQSAA